MRSRGNLIAVHIFPRAHVTIESPLTYDDAMRRLSSEVGTRFAGEVKGAAFSISRKAPYRSMLRPAVMTGRVMSRPPGTTIEVDIVAGPGHVMWTILILVGALLLVLGAVGLALEPTTQSLLRALVCPVGAIAVGWLGYITNFRMELGRSLFEIRNLFNPRR